MWQSVILSLLLAWGYTTAFILFSSTRCSPLISLRFSLCLLAILFSYSFKACFPPFFHPLLLLSLSLSFHSTGLMFFSVLLARNVFLITACVSSYLPFFYQWPPHMPEKKGRGRFGGLMLSAGGDFTTRVRGPSVARGGPRRKGSDMGASNVNSLQCSLTVI